MTLARSPDRPESARLNSLQRGHIRRILFDQPHASSDGGAILLKACDERLGLTEHLARCIVDVRQTGKVEHSIRDLIRQRLYGIACGYADCNDASRLAEDPIQKLLIGHDPLSGAALASQPTLSRLRMHRVVRICTEWAKRWPRV
jgi:DDE family transposase